MTPHTQLNKIRYEYDISSGFARGMDLDVTAAAHKEDSKQLSEKLLGQD